MWQHVVLCVLSFTWRVPESQALSNTRSLRSSLKVSDQLSHPYKTTGRITIAYTLHKTHPNILYIAYVRIRVSSDMTPFGLVHTSILTLRRSLLPPPSRYCPFFSWATLKSEAEGRSDTLAHMYQSTRHYHHITGSSLILYIKVKVKWSRYRPGLAQRVGRGIALLFHDHGTRRGWVVSSTPRPHFTPGKDTVPILQEPGWAQGWSGWAKNLAPTGIRSRTVQPVVSRYTDWATWPTHYHLLLWIYY